MKKGLVRNIHVPSDSFDFFIVAVVHSKDKPVPMICLHSSRGSSSAASKVDIDPGRLVLSLQRS